MKPDYYAVLAQQAYRKGFQEIDYNDMDAVTARYHVLVATGHKDDKDTGGNALRGEWAQKRLKVQMDPLPEFIQPPSVDLSQLPLGSFFIQFTFKLLKPYISRDDNSFYIVDNPIVRDKVFRYPMVRPTAWKGSLRHALWQLGYQEDDEGEKGKQIQRLFGTANDDQPDEGNSGRLYLYPSFFDQLSLEVINPHNRETGAGSLPIYFEAVPIKATGTFTLLYVPLDSLGEGEVEIRRQTLADLQLAAKALEALFTLYGFGAKTSSGFGLAGDVVDNGRLALKLPEVTFPQDDAPQAQKPDDEYRKYLDESGQVKPVFEGSGEGGLLSNNEYKQTGEQYGGGTLSEFKSFRRWYGEHGAQWQTSLQRGAVETDYPESSFESLSQLTALCQNLEAEPDATRGGDA